MNTKNEIQSTLDTAITMTSHEIAELTGKQHFHIKRDIRKMFDALKKDDPSFGYHALKCEHMVQVKIGSASPRPLASGFEFRHDQRAHGRYRSMTTKTR